jgi:hypothetical protein
MTYLIESSVLLKLAPEIVEEASELVEDTLTEVIIAESATDDDDPPASDVNVVLALLLAGIEKFDNG